MNWIQNNAVALMFGVLSIFGSISGIYVVLSNTDAIMITKIVTLEKNADQQQALGLQYWKDLNTALKENTKALNSVNTAVSVSNERWETVNRRLDKLERGYIR